MKSMYHSILPQILKYLKSFDTFTHALRHRQPTIEKPRRARYDPAAAGPTVVHGRHSTTPRTTTPQGRR